RVADEQCPPRPAFAAAERGDRDDAADESEQNVVNAVHPEKHHHVRRDQRESADELRPGPAGVTLVPSRQDRLATWAEQVIWRCSGPCAPRDVSDVDDEDENPRDALQSFHALLLTRAVRR